MRLVAHIPGLTAALVAFFVLKLTAFALSTGGQLLVYLAAYAAVAIAVDVGLRRYAQRRG